MPKTPTSRPIAWISVIPQFVVMGVITFLWAQTNTENYFLYGALTYLVLSQLTKRVLAKSHRKGIRNTRKGNFSEAIPYFKKSYDFFNKSEWIDKYRSITLLSAAQMRYKEMALVNIAFSYSQLGDGKSSRSYYEQCLKEFPDNGMAHAALNMLNAEADIEK